MERQIVDGDDEKEGNILTSHTQDWARIYYKVVQKGTRQPPTVMGKDPPHIQIPCWPLSLEGDLSHLG